MEFRSACVVGPGRVGTRRRRAALRVDADAPRPTASWRSATPTSSSSASPTGRSHEVAAAIPVGPVDRAHERRAHAGRARPARPPLQPAPAADHRPRPRARAARRRVGGRERRRPARRSRPASGSPACSASGPSSWRTRDRLVYHAGAVMAQSFLVALHAAAAGALRGGRRAAGGAPPAHAADDGERLRADRPDHPRRLGDDRAPPRGHPRAASRAGADVPGAHRHDGRGGRRAVMHPPHDRRAPRGARACSARARASGSCRRWARSTRGTRRWSGARAPSATSSSPASSSTRRSSAPREDLDRYPRDEEGDAALAGRLGRRPPLRAVGRGDVPAGLPDLGRRRGARRRPRGRRRGPATSAASPPSA